MNYFILLCVIAGWLISTGIILLVFVNKYFGTKRELLQNEKSLLHQRMCINNTNDVLEFVKDVTASTAVTKFRTFKDGRDMSKITSANVEELVKEVASASFESINLERFYENDVLFTSDYYMSYITETSIILIKELLEKAVNDLLEEE